MSQARACSEIGPVSSVDDALAAVRASGGRVTASRRLVLEVLFGAGDRHMTAEEIAQGVQASAPDVYLSTVYRNLEEFQRLGVVVHAHLGHGPVTYQLASMAHAHFICEGCGATMRVNDGLFSGLARRAKAEMGFTIDPHHVAILGRCANCG